MENHIVGNHYEWVRVARIIAMFAVLFNHTVANFIFQWSMPINKWLIADFYGALIRFAVPVFIILSGYLLLDKQENDVDFYKKRFLKIVIPLIVWSAVFMAVKTGSIYSVFTFEFFKDFFAGNIYIHLYFLYVIIGLYAVTPILRRILPHINIKYLYLYLMFWLISSSLIPALYYFNIQLYNIFEYATGYIGYYLIGYLIKTITISKNISRILIPILVSSVLAIFLSMWYFSIKNNHVDSTFAENLALPVVIQSVCVVVLIKNWIEGKDFKSKILAQIDKTTMGIYLIHMIFLRIFLKIISDGDLVKISPSFFNFYQFDLVYSIPLVVFVLFICSFVSVSIIQRIPLIKYIVP